MGELAPTFAEASGELRRALWLRALAARLDSPREQRRQELQDFVEQLNSTSEEDLVRECTLLPSPGAPPRPVQRYTTSCGPAVIQIMLSEHDPIFALSQERFWNFEREFTDEIAIFQKDLLEEHGGVAVRRKESLVRTRVNSWIRTLGEQDKLSKEQQQDTKRYLNLGGKMTSMARDGLSTLREAFSGAPTVSEVRRLRSHPVSTRGEGLDSHEFLTALNETLSAPVGVTFVITEPPGGFGPGKAKNHFSTAARLLRQGLWVPFGTANPDHWMLMVNVKGSAPKRCFLVIDPEKGRSAWIKERELCGGHFLVQPFALTSKPNGHIDCFFFSQPNEESPRGS